MARRRSEEKFKGAEFVQKSTEKFKNKKKSTAKSDTSAGRPKKAAASATAKKYGSAKKSTKILLNKLSINKKPVKTVTNDLDVQRLTKYTNTKKPTKTSKPATKTKLKASVTSNMGAGAGSSQTIKVTDPENSSKTIHSPSSNMEGISSLSSISERLQEQLVDTKKKNWRDLMQEIRDRH